MATVQKHDARLYRPRFQCNHFAKEEGEKEVKIAFILLVNVAFILHFFQ